MMRKYSFISLVVLYAIILFGLNYIIRIFQIQEPYHTIIMITGFVLIGLLNVVFGKFFPK